MRARSREVPPGSAAGEGQLWPHDALRSHLGHGKATDGRPAALCKTTREEGLPNKSLPSRSLTQERSTLQHIHIHNPQREENA